MSALEFETVVPEGAEDGTQVIVLLHGRGTDRRDLKGLAPHLPAGYALVTPEAPFEAARWGYGPGWAWYRYRGEDQVVSETLEESLSRLEAFLEELPEHLPFHPGKVVVGGFSQGGTLSLAHALRNPGAIPQVVNLSGFLVDDPLVPVDEESVEGTRFFWGHGRQDPAIPHALATRGRDRLRTVGADLTVHDHPAGHTISLEELSDLSRWLEEGG